jgi:anti-sigma B factor antagonist
LIDLHITTELLGDGSRVIAVAGELDLYTAPQLTPELMAPSSGGRGAVIVDLTECTFLDSTALGVLANAKKAFVPKGVELSLVISDRNILKVFEITGLNRVFTIHPTRAEAVAGR